MNNIQQKSQKWNFEFFTRKNKCDKPICKKMGEMFYSVTHSQEGSNFFMDPTITKNASIYDETRMILSVCKKHQPFIVKDQDENRFLVWKK